MQTHDTSRLCLTRRPGESLWIGDARIKVEKLSGGRCRLYIEAPRSVPVLRDELREARDNA